MFSRMVNVAIVFFSLVAVGTAEERLIRSTAAYQADVRVQAGSLAVSGPIHITPEKEKRIMQVEGSRVRATLIITRRDKGIIWVLNPQQKSYYAIPLKGEGGKTKGLLPSALIEKVEVGPETVDGIPTLKYKVKFAPRGESQLVGYIWVSPDHILVRVEGETLSKGRSRPFRMTLENLKIGPQPAALFEVPKDFVQVPPSHPTLGIMAPAPRRGREGAPVMLK